MFPRGSKKYFLGKARSGDILFYPLQTKKTTFSCYDLMGK